MKKQEKEFWEYNGEQLCSLKGVQTLAEKISGIRPSRNSVNRWLAYGLMYKTYVSCRYVFRVETVEKFLLNRSKPREQYSYKKEESTK